MGKKLVGFFSHLFLCRVIPLRRNGEKTERPDKLKISRNFLLIKIFDLLGCSFLKSFYYRACSITLNRVWDVSFKRVRFLLEEWITIRYRISLISLTLAVYYIKELWKKLFHLLHPFFLISFPSLKLVPSFHLPKCSSFHHLSRESLICPPLDHPFVCFFQLLFESSFSRVKHLEEEEEESVENLQDAWKNLISTRKVCCTIDGRKNLIRESSERG